MPKGEERSESTTQILKEPKNLFQNEKRLKKMIQKHTKNLEIYLKT